MYQGCFKGVSWVSQGYCIFVSKAIQGSFNCALKMFQGCFKDNSFVVLGFFNGAFKGVSKVFEGKFRLVSRLF